MSHKWGMSLLHLGKEPPKTTGHKDDSDPVSPSPWLGMFSAPIPQQPVSPLCLMDTTFLVASGPPRSRPSAHLQSLSLESQLPF
jgi:hypothetical protein